MNSFTISSSEVSAAWIFDQNELPRLLSRLGFRPDLIEYLGRLASAMDAAQRAEFLPVAEQWLAGKPPHAGVGSEGVEALVAVAALPLMVQKHRARKLPFEISQATALDLQRRMQEARERTGNWGFDRLSWIHNHVHRGLLEIGRLQYLPAPYGAPFRIYSHKTSGDLFAFPEAGRFCSEAGWLEQGSDAFETVLEENGKTIVGHPVDFESGRILRNPITLSSAEYDLRLSREMTVWHLHIPSGGGLTPETSAESMRRAMRIFEAHYPEVDWKAFCCTSWLLDRELEKCLPAESNIVAFGRMFLPLATPNATSTQLFQRVFENQTDWSSFIPRTSLQRAIIGHLKKGETFRNTSGVILRNFLPRLVAKSSFSHSLPP